MSFEPILSSFRDPGATVFSRSGQIYRQINEAAFDDYQQLMSSGLYAKLVSLGYLVPHAEAPITTAQSSAAKVVIQPEKIEFISYPYEWCFSQLKDAALLTLEITKLAFEHGMILKDASAYNVQFHQGRPIFIDTSSFEIYKKGSPWIAYNQFCKHFLAPLALMAKKDIRLNSLLRPNIDGVPLDLASSLLPWKTWLSFSLFVHIHAHAKSQSKYSDDQGKTSVSVKSVSSIGLLGMLDNLSSLVKSLEWKPVKTEWGDYYSQTNYSDAASSHKAEIIRNLVAKIRPNKIWDLGGNNGYYSRIAAGNSASVVSCDIDPVAVETNYRKAVSEKNKNILPLLQDLTNPSPSIGWAHSERDSLQKRGQADLIMALALIHHLAISNNVPLARVAEYFSKLGSNLLIEFVPKEDSQVKRLLASRKDIFPDYNVEGFKQAFGAYFDVVEEINVNETHRRMFLLKRKISN